MSNLTEFKDLLENFKADFQQLNENHGSECADRPSEQAELIALYEKNVSNLRMEYKTEAEAICKKLLSAEKYCTLENINFDVLDHLAKVESLDVVNKEIMLAMMVDVYRSPSVATIEKLKNVLSKKNVNTTIPDPVKAAELIKAIADEVVKVVETFDIDNWGYTPHINPSWISSLEIDFAEVTTSDLKSTSKKALYDALESRVNLSSLDSVVENYHRNYVSRIR